MTQDSKEIFPETLRSFDSATLLPAFQPIGTPSGGPIRITKFTNLSNVTVFVSWDGVDVHEVFAPGASLTLDVTTNHYKVQEGWFVRKNLQFFLRGPAAGVGNFYISLYGGEA